MFGLAEIKAINAWRSAGAHLSKSKQVKNRRVARTPVKAVYLQGKTTTLN